MKGKIVLLIGILFGAATIIVLILVYAHTVTPLDRPFIISKDKEIIVATHIRWMCHCADFIDTTRYRINPVAEGEDGDFFFIEPVRPELLWDENLHNRYVKLAGYFYIDKGIPEVYNLGHIEDKPDHARVFRYESIEYLP